MYARVFVQVTCIAAVGAFALGSLSRPAHAQKVTTVDSVTTLGTTPTRPDLTGAEIGLFPTAMHYTADVGSPGAWGGGLTLGLGYFFNNWFGIEGQGPVTINPNLNNNAKYAPNFYSATGSLIFVDPMSRIVQPYIALGGGYNWYYFHTPAFSSYQYRLNNIVGHGGVGVRFRLGDVAALRVEATTDVSRRRPSEEGLFGVSLFPWVHSAKPQMERTVVTRQLLRVDTLRTTDTVHTEVHDTVTVSRVQVRTQIDTSVILVLQDVNFASGRSVLAAGASPVLNRLATQLNATALSGVPIEIRGYTDSIGSDSLNYKLGLARAQAVADYLTQQGVDQKRLTVTSGGKDDPIAPNSTAAGRARNRRVVIRRAAVGR